jgi:4-hydroxy-tetrahydrodipicolinate synthase
MKRLGRMLTAMVTAFDARGAVDLDESVRVAEYLIARGNDGVVVSGTTGESPALEDEEKLALFAAIKKKFGTRASVIAGTTGSNTRQSIALTKRAEACGVDAILATVPSYNKPTQDGLLRHFGAIAEATPLPIVLYNVPSRTAMNMLPATVHELARRHANIVGIKESTGDVHQFTVLIHDNPREDFTIWCGDDYFFLPALALGAFGLVSVAAHLCGPQLRALADAFARGENAEAARIHGVLQPLFRALFATSSPIPVKWAMNQRGFAVGECRSPLGAMPEELARELESLMLSHAP